MQIEADSRSESELVSHLAERIATANGGKVWIGGSHTRVYVRHGKKQGYISVDSSKEVSYSRDIGQSLMYAPLVAAGIVSISDVTSVVV